jgi:hypothetical protein
MLRTRTAAFTLFLVATGLGQIALFWVQLRLIRYSLNDAMTALTFISIAAGGFPTARIAIVPYSGDFGLFGSIAAIRQRGN